MLGSALGTKDAVVGQKGGADGNPGGAGFDGGISEISWL